MYKQLLLVIALLAAGGCSNEGYVYPRTIAQAEKACEPYNGIRRYIPMLWGAVGTYEVEYLGVQCEDGTVFNIEANETRDKK